MWKAQLPATPRVESASLYLVSVQEELVLVGLQFKLLLHVLLLLGGPWAVVLQRKHNPRPVTLHIQIHAFIGELNACMVSNGRSR